MTTAKQAAERLADSFDVDVHEGAAGSRPSQATQLVDMALTAVSLWHSDEGDPFATMKVKGHHENWPLRSKQFRNFLDYTFFRSHGKVVNSQARQGAIDTLSGLALFESPEHAVHTRIAEEGGYLYLDLGNAGWEVVKIGPEGWVVTIDPPVKFRRPNSTKPLPMPIHGGSLDGIRRFLNLGSDSDWSLVKAWLVQSVFAIGPFVILILAGEAGTAKSTTALVLKVCVDPTTAPLRSPARNEHDLVIAARNSQVIAFDNLSYLSGTQSDALCRLATGGGLGTRQLFTDAEESLFDVQRPIILNGITDLAHRGDLLDRCIPITLPVIDEDERRDEEVFWHDFTQAHPTILGGLLDTVAGALKELPGVKLNRLPRMADFARRAVAAERGQGLGHGSFMAAYAKNRAGADDTALEASPVACALAAFMASKDEWSGTAAELLNGLNGVIEEATTRRKGWPVDGAQLGKILRRNAPNLRRAGTDVQFDTPKRRTITVRKGRDFADTTDMPSQEPQEDGATGVDGHDSDVSNDSEIHNLSNEEVLEF